MAIHGVRMVQSASRPAGTVPDEATLSGQAGASGGPPVLALTTFNDDELLSGALRAGAAGFVLKDSSAEELIRAVRTVARGDSYLDPAVTARVLTRTAKPRRRHARLRSPTSPRVNSMC